MSPSWLLWRTLVSCASCQPGFRILLLIYFVGFGIRSGQIMRCSTPLLEKGELHGCFDDRIGCPAVGTGAGSFRGAFPAPAAPVFPGGTAGPTRMPAPLLIHSSFSSGLWAASGKVRRFFLNPQTLPPTPPSFCVCSYSQHYSAHSDCLEMLVPNCHL